MEKQEINLIDFYLLVYSKRYYFLLSILIGLLVTFGYYFLYNQNIINLTYLYIIILSRF